ncbi:hypothetical protein ACGFYZ_20630 [Streptomyces sp. NPDC048330]|uniref:hypothetical protein n=1 Tax=Streptomyces sp. NPDC048330 TaxID=3365533 RepID=UPI00371FE8DD
MSDDVAYPVFRYPDPVLALSVARHLMMIGHREYTTACLYAELRSVAEVRRGAKELPEGWFRRQELSGEVDVPFEDLPAWLVGVRGSGLPADPTSYERRLPVEYELLDQGVDSVEHAFTTAIGPSPGEINRQHRRSPSGRRDPCHGGPMTPEMMRL